MEIQPSGWLDTKVPNDCCFDATEIVDGEAIDAHGAFAIHSMRLAKLYEAMAGTQRSLLDG